MMKLHNVLLALLFCLPLQLLAQEVLVDLVGNGQLTGHREHLLRKQDMARNSGDTLELPFFDDFSEPFSRLHEPADLYPSPNLWADDYAYVNNHMAINPISQGVATLDGLDPNGLAYGFGFALAQPSDTLSSHPINLEGAADSVYLSFFYQAQGMGNAPEAEDILVLQFQNDTAGWERVWDADGYILEDYRFNRQMIHVPEEYHYKGFRFRFINYSSRSGSVDHWHLDYIELDGGRSLADTVIRDVSLLPQSTYLAAEDTFQHTAASILKEYAAMPWTHYKEDPSAFMGDTAYFTLRNNFNDFFNPNFALRINDHTGAQVYDGLTSTSQVPAWVICGNELNTCNVNPANNFNFRLSEFGFTQFPTGAEVSPDSTFFELRYELGVVDDNDTNDVNVIKQKFYNYYAYDDGTAELAYGLGALDSEGKVAVRYDIKKRDTLRGIQIYLNPVGEDISEEPVRLAVWAGNEEPTDLIWESADTNLSFSSGINYFYDYAIDTVLDVEGNIWVGWIQQAAPGVKFSVGFDQRSDFSQNVYYNLGTNWTQSSIPGAVMIRPTFGQDYDFVSGVDDRSARSPEWHLYPNPSSGLFRLPSAQREAWYGTQLTVLDLTGRTVHMQTATDEVLDLQHLPNGAYIVTIESAERGRSAQRIIIR